MKKIIAQIFVCSSVILFHSLVEVFPVFQKFSKKKICEIETDSILTFDKLKKMTSHLSKEELLQLKEFRDEFCYEKK
jgi:hypothetical protein